LEDCFANLVITEQLDNTNKWFCPHCNDKVNAYKKFNIWIPPKIMIIQLKRFIHNFSPQGYSAHKLNNTIEYPVTNFDITPYMSSCSKKVAGQVGNFTYDLIGVSNHIGNMNGGHYYSFIKSVTDGNWYCADDDSITLMNEEDIVSPNAYILFYKQCENSEDLLPIQAYTQKRNIIYVYTNEEAQTNQSTSTRCWSIVSKDKFVRFLNSIQLKILKALSEWRKKNIEMLNNNDKTSILYDKTYSKVMDPDFKLEKTYIKFYNNIYNKLKIPVPQQ
jgi:hypothetical protein